MQTEDCSRKFSTSNFKGLIANNGQFKLKLPYVSCNLCVLDHHLILIKLLLYVIHNFAYYLIIIHLCLTLNDSHQVFYIIF